MTPSALTDNLKMVPRPLVVKAIRQELADVVTLEAEAHYPFAPGQFSMLTAFGVGEAAISLSGDPQHPDRVRHTIRAVGPVTAKLAALEPGDVVGIRGPFGTPWPVEDARDRDLLIISGGIGLAPLRPLVYRALSNPDEFHRVTLLHGARLPSQILFADELARWSERFEVRVTVDQAGPGWTGQVGVVPQLIDGALGEPDRTVAFICGPEVMMRFAAIRLCELGVPPAQIFLSLERHMKCGIGECGRCQLGPLILCRDGPVFDYARTRALLAIREL